MGQAESSSIPTLTDVLVPGDPARARAEAEALPPDDAAIPVLVDVVAPGKPAPARTCDAAASPHETLHPAPDAALPVQTAVDAQHIAARLQHRLTTYLAGEGREAIEARCRAALNDHTAWLVGQITHEVALALETEVMEWVREAVDDEIARRHTGHSG